MYVMWRMGPVRSLEASVKVGSVYKREVNLSDLYCVIQSLLILKWMDSFYGCKPTGPCITTLYCSCLQYSPRFIRTKLTNLLPFQLHSWYRIHNNRLSPLLHCFGPETPQPHNEVIDVKSPEQRPAAVF